MKLGLIGSNIGHTKSPLAWRTLCALGGHDCEYKVLDIDPKKESFRASVTKFFRSGGDLLSVTSPYKDVAFSMCDSTTKAAKASRSVNTITMDLNGRLWGDDTDGTGFLLAFNHSSLNAQKIKSILILGTGPVARSIINALDTVTIWEKNITIATRTPELGILREDYAVLKKHKVVGYNKLEPKYDLIIDCTSVSETLVPITTTCSYGYTVKYQMSEFEARCLNDDTVIHNGESMLMFQALNAYNLNFAKNKEPITTFDYPFLTTLLRIKRQYHETATTN